MGFEKRKNDFSEIYAVIYTEEITGEYLNDFLYISPGSQESQDMSVLMKGILQDSSYKLKLIFLEKYSKIRTMIRALLAPYDPIRPTD